MSTTKSNVTIDDIYRIVQRVEDKMDSRLKDVENDVDNLKSFQNKALGIVSLVGIFSGTIASFVWERIVGRQA